MILQSMLTILSEKIEIALNPKLIKLLEERKLTESQSIP
jgi:hypothetical protein